MVELSPRNSPLLLAGNTIGREGEGPHGGLERKEGLRGIEGCPEVPQRDVDENEIIEKHTLDAFSCSWVDYQCEGSTND